MFRELQERFRIPCEQIVIYGSSGLAETAPHKDILATEIQEKTGREMEFISAEEEAIFIFDGVVPEWRRDEVVLLDIGSGNIKGVYLEDPQRDKYATFSIPLGTASFTEAINNSRANQNFIVAAENAKYETLIPQISDVVQRNPGMQNLSRVYLAGGISWAMSTLVRPCDQEQTIERREERNSLFLRLYPEDINTFYNNATRDQATLFQPDLSICNIEQRERAEKDIQTIKTRVFSIDNLIAGSEILRAFSEELYFPERERLFFARYAIEALPIGYLMQQLEATEQEAAE